MKLYLDNRIFELQTQGGISQIWKNLITPLKNAFYAADWRGREENIFLSTYYAAPPTGFVSISLVYDCIGERYKPIGSHHPDVIDKAHALAAAQGVIAISQWSADDVSRMYGKPAHVAYPGTNIQRADSVQVADFKARHQLRNPYALLVGRRGLYKNAQALYQAWPYWSGAQSHTLLCVGGEAPTFADNLFAERWPRRVKQVSLSDNDLACAYSGAALMVYPSFYEGFGLPVLEALACGCPVVCGEGGALREVGSDIPYYADVFRPLSIAKRMNEALELNIERRMDGMKRARLFTYEAMAQQMVEAIQSIMMGSEGHANVA